MNNVKFDWSGYWDPTPASIRKLADALLGASQFASALTIVSGHATIGIIISVVSVLAKFASNFFTDKPKENV